MKIGAKIKSVRKHKGMTQAELAGDYITRNMLSRIETDDAIPSIPTLMYLAEKLDVSPGYFLCDADDENNVDYIKLSIIADIRKAYIEKNYRACINICDDLDYADNEIAYALAKCCIKGAQEEYFHGRFMSASDFISHALKATAITIFDTSSIVATARLLSKLIDTVNNADIYPFNPDDLISDASAEIFIYFKILYLLYIGDRESADVLFSVHQNISVIYRMHIESYFLYTLEEYKSAADILEELLLTHEPQMSAYMLYKIYTELEICTKNTEDFKRAYEYAVKRNDLIARTKK